MYHLSSDSEDFDEQELQLPQNPSLELAQHSRAQHLRSTLQEHPPFCCGTVDALSDNCVLFYGKNEYARSVHIIKVLCVKVEPEDDVRVTGIHSGGECNRDATQ